MSLTVGSVAPDFEQKDQNGDLVNFRIIKVKKLSFIFILKIAPLDVLHRLVTSMTTWMHSKLKDMLYWE
jgi:hypothetical protein